MKKKLLFMLINMNVGGTEKALLNMIEEIPMEKYDVTVFMLEKYGEFMGCIPDGVHIEYFEGYKQIKAILNQPPKVSTMNLLKEGKIFEGLIIGCIHIFTKLMKDRSLLFRYLIKNHPDIQKEYDVAIAYDGPMDFISYFVMNKIKAKTKIQWIHFDITKIGFNKHFSSRIYKKFNKVFVVSNEGLKKLIHVLPSIKEKTEVFSNIVSPRLIFSQAKEGPGFKDQFEGLRILTVGRLTSEKGHDLAIQVLANLIANGHHVKWYCVGDGHLREEYEKLIDKFNLRGKFIFLGGNPNPYPYIEQCDIYVQPSRHEGYCIALAEARCLRKAIVTTNFAGAMEQIKNGETGLIVNFDEEQIYKAIVNLIQNNDLSKKFIKNLAEEKFDYTAQMEKVYSMF